MMRIFYHFSLIITLLSLFTGLKLVHSLPFPDQGFRTALDSSVIQKFFQTQKTTLSDPNISLRNKSLAIKDINKFLNKLVHSRTREYDTFPRFKKSKLHETLYFLVADADLNQEEESLSLYTHFLYQASQLLFRVEENPIPSLTKRYRFETDSKKREAIRLVFAKLGKQANLAVPFFKKELLRIYQEGHHKKQAINVALLLGIIGGPDVLVSLNNKIK